MNEFFVNNFRVDMLRSQIINQADVRSMEPRVLQVLLLLAQNQGQVVSHQEILDAVWPDVVIEGNAIQRCIVQLRKALNDDAKNQTIILTHPKKGYSLVAEVSAQDGQTSLDNKSQFRYWRWSVIVLVFCLFLAVLYFFYSQENKLSFNKLVPITATDKKEFYPSFSPDGRYLAFNRYLGGCQSQIWAKDLRSKKEYLLTKDVGIYGQVAWSPDGTQLAFSQKDHCRKQQLLPNCQSITSIAFFLALGKPQETSLLLSCTEKSYGGINWITNERIAFIANRNGHGDIHSLSIGTGEVSSLFSQANLNPSALTYSQRNKQLVITFMDATNKPNLLFLDLDTGESKTIGLNVPDVLSGQLWWDPIWHPHKDSFIVSAKNSLFEITLEGNFIQYEFPAAQNIHTPAFHPVSANIAASMGVVDLDIGELGWSGSAPTDAENLPIQQILHRSIVEDYNAQYQPNNKGIAFISHQSGDAQIWLEQNGELSQLSHFHQNFRINSYLWSQQSNALIVARKGRLQLLMLDGRSTPLKTPFSVTDVFQWLDESTLLLSVVHEEKRKLVQFNINNGNFNTLYNGITQWAQLTPNNHLYFIDQQHRLMMKDNKHIAAVSLLENERVNQKFIYKQGRLILFTQNNQLLSIDVKTLQQSLWQLPKLNSEYFVINDVDIDKGRLLYSTVSSARKEIVMFVQQ